MDENVQKKLDQARAFRNLLRYEQAIAILIELYAKEPDDIDICQELTYCLLQNGNAEEALQFAQKLIILDPEDPYSYYSLALAWQQNRNTTEALDAIEICLHIDPEFVPAYSGAASIYTDIRQYRSALQYATKGLEIEPNNYLCTCHRLACLTNLKLIPELEASAEIGMRVYSQSGYMHYIKGRYHMLKIEPSQARKYFLEALRLEPTSTGYEADMLQALRDSNPLKYAGLKLDAFFKNNTVRIIVVLSLLLFTDIFIAKYKPPVILSVAAAAILLFLYLIYRPIARISDHYTNLYLWARPETRHFLNQSDKVKVIIALALTIAVLVALIRSGWGRALVLLFLFWILDRVYRVFIKGKWIH